uniref:BLUF domain-containing protein n=1 Tax=Cairina moschata TaxID=8855 RepID=A0A8C3C2I4_CAIMO
MEAAQWDSAEPAAPERQNLLGLRRLQQHGQEQARLPLHRLLVTARLGEAAAEQEVAGYHRGLFEYASKYNSREPVSGLLLVCSSYVLHVVESCSSTIHLVIRDLASLQDQGPSALLQDIKVAVVAHNIPTRQFPDWYVTVVTSPVTHLEDTTELQPAEGTVTECLNLLFRVAACTPKPAEDDSEDVTDSPYTLVPDLQIPAETISRLCRVKECTSPGDFLRMYLSPLQLALDSAHGCPGKSELVPGAAPPEVAHPEMLWDGTALSTCSIFTTPALQTEAVWPIPSHFSA